MDSGCVLGILGGFLAGGAPAAAEMEGIGLGREGEERERGMGRNRRGAGKWEAGGGGEEIGIPARSNFGGAEWACLFAPDGRKS